MYASKLMNIEKRDCAIQPVHKERRKRTCSDHYAFIVVDTQPTSEALKMFI